MSKNDFSISTLTQDFLAQGQHMTPVRIKAIRKSFSLSQSKFADFIGMNLRTLQSWEGGYKHPSSPAVALLYLAETQPLAFVNNRKKLLEQFKNLAVLI